MEEWVDGVAQQFERVTGNPLADAVRGTVRIVALSEPEGRGSYRPSRVELLAQADGVPPRVVIVEAVFPRKHWPKAGTVLPARISPTHADAVEVDWDALPR
ncbi:hypothetical protein ABCS02_12485 [Microbacterium sp. X-17]|uniref:hypothetical protein n=1 Tax=Microbacterium sp. X-17 TaxID=3144404 RepID=UPI0031F507A7